MNVSANSVSEWTSYDKVVASSNTMQTEVGGARYIASTDRVSMHIDNAKLATAIGLTAEKIKKDEVICGVTGTYEGGSVNVPAKDVNFFDYDGTILYSYTASEFQALTQMPENPTHDGLTAQGWNWSLTNAKAQLNSDTTHKLNIGQLYVTNDGATRLYIKLTDGRLTPYLGFAINGTATIDWGDGNTEQVTGNSNSTIIKTPHTYQNIGDYCISISSSVDILLLPENNDTTFLTGNGIGDMSYRNAVQKVELGNNVKNLNAYTFNNYNNLTTTTTPIGLKITGERVFYYCYNLKAFIFAPDNDNTLTIYDYCFYMCTSLETVVFADGDSSGYISVIQNYAFGNNKKLKYITLPSIYRIKDYAFAGTFIQLDTLDFSKGLVEIGSRICNGCGIRKFYFGTAIVSLKSDTFDNIPDVILYDFSKLTALPSSGLPTFSGIQADCKIVVPDNLYNSFISTWSSVATHIVRNSDYYGGN